MYYGSQEEYDHAMDAAGQAEAEAQAGIGAEQFEEGKRMIGLLELKIQDHYDAIDELKEQISKIASEYHC